MYKMKTTTKKPTKKKHAAKKGIAKNMTFAEILQKHPEAGDVLFESGLHCIGCGMAMYETLEQGCLSHGMSKKEIDALIIKVNKKIK
jgi:hybrid cluster-associated redox disulfide protein